MKCPRNKFVRLDYKEPVDPQKQDICRGCSDYNGKEWGKHCKACVKCVRCGIDLPVDYFDKIPKATRSDVTHGVCEECRKKIAGIVDGLRRQNGRRPW